jgi:hypothetical protein
MQTIHEDKKAARQDEASHVQDYSSNSFEGKVVSITDSRLVLSNKEGKEYSHTLAKGAKITSDGTACETHHLLVGTKIRVTTKNDDRTVVTCIEALDKNAEFAKGRNSTTSTDRRF